MEKWLILLKNKYLIEFVTLLCLIIVAIIGFYVSRKIILPLIHKFLKRTQVTWDDLLTDNKVFGRLMLLIPAMIIHYGLSLVPEFYDFFIQNHPYLCLFCHHCYFKQLSGCLCCHLQHPAHVL